jgi:hypothetical protein
MRQVTPLVVVITLAAPSAVATTRVAPVVAAPVVAVPVEGASMQVALVVAVQVEGALTQVALVVAVQVVGAPTAVVVEAVAVAIFQVSHMCSRLCSHSSRKGCRCCQLRPIHPEAVVPAVYKSILESTHYSSMRRRHFRTAPSQLARK